MTPLRAIRFAMLVGVLLFGGVSWFFTRTPAWTPAQPGVAERLTLIARMIWIAVGIALPVMFLKFRDKTNSARDSTVAIVAWTLGETLALFGGVILFLTAKLGWYVAGVIALCVTMIAFPAPPPVSR